ncbi:hypothetical protein ACFQ9R_11020 [Nocardia sp. NPDC056541]|uniref:hypothetical protein n=1 Tax=unclassified Nocardia TaxID=2637762 RepID=UPI00367070CC
MTVLTHSSAPDKRRVADRSTDTTTKSLTVVEQQVLDVLAPGGLLTADTIARNLNMSPWRVARALNSLRRNGDAFRNQHAQWRVTVGQPLPERQSSR